MGIIDNGARCSTHQSYEEPKLSEVQKKLITVLDDLSLYADRGTTGFFTATIDQSQLDDKIDLNPDANTYDHNEDVTYDHFNIELWAANQRLENQGLNASASKWLLKYFDRNDGDENQSININAEKSFFTYNSALEKEFAAEIEKLNRDYNSLEERSAYLSLLQFFFPEQYTAVVRARTQPGPVSPDLLR